MKLSTFYSKVAKHMKVTGKSKFICINVGEVRGILYFNTNNPKLRTHYEELAIQATSEIQLLCSTSRAITSHLPSVFLSYPELLTRQINKADGVIATRFAAYRRFILKFLAARAKLAGN